MEMTPAAGLSHLFWMVFVGSAPTLVVAALAGLLIAILQGVTQIQDQTLPQVVKTGAAMLMLLLFGSMSFGPIYKVFVRYLEMIPAVAQ